MIGHSKNFLKNFPSNISKLIFFFAKNDYGFRNQNYSKTGGYGQPYTPYNGTQNESVNQWNYNQPNNYLMQHNELPARRTQETIRTSFQIAV